MTNFGQAQGPACKGEITKERPITGGLVFILGRVWLTHQNHLAGSSKLAQAARVEVHTGRYGCD